MNMEEHMTDAELQRLDAATEWLERLREGALDDAALAAWLRWSADADNLREFEHLQGIWTGVGKLAQSGMLAPPRRHAGRRYVLGGALAAALVLGIGIGVWLTMGPPMIAVPITFSTPLATHSDIPLPDGSRIELGALSQVSTVFTDESRGVTVESGQAYFVVAKDPQRPFIVRSGDVQVTAVGTAFDVHKGTNRIVVTVTEGAVKVATVDVGRLAAPIAVGAGEQVIYSARERRFVVARSDAAAATAWRRDVLKFVDVPLGDVVADLNRYSHQQILIDDARLASLPYTGTVFRDQIDEWFSALEDAFPLRIDASDKEHVRLVPREVDATAAAR